MFKCMIKKYLILVAVVVFLFAGAGQAYALGGTQTSRRHWRREDFVCWPL